MSGLLKILKSKWFMIRMDEPDGQLIAGCKQLFIDLELQGLFKWAWTFRQVNLQEPAVRLVIDRDGTLNLAHLVPCPKTEKAPATVALSLEAIQ